MMIKVEEKNVQETLEKFKKFKGKEYNRSIQTAFVRYMDTIKLMSSNEIISRTVPKQITGRDGKSRRPTGRELYEMQPTSPGRLTSRTGRMVRGLREGKNHVGTGWLGLGNKNAKTNPSIHKTLNGRMRTTDEEISAWWSAYVRSGSITLKGISGEGAGPEKKRVAFRYMWETGIRGVKRQYMQPVQDKLKGKLLPQVSMELQKGLRRAKL